MNPENWGPQNYGLNMKVTIQKGSQHNGHVLVPKPTALCLQQ